MKQLLFLFLLLINLTAIAQNPPPLKQRSDGSFTQGDTYLAVLKGLQIPSGTVNTLTGTGTRVNLFYNTEDKVLYIHNGIEWKPAIESDLTKFYTKAEVDQLFADNSNNFIKNNPTSSEGQSADINISGSLKVGGTASTNISNASISMSTQSGGGSINYNGLGFGSAEGNFGLDYGSVRGGTSAGTFRLDKGGIVANESGKSVNLTSSYLYLNDANINRSVNISPSDLSFRNPGNKTLIVQADDIPANSMINISWPVKTGRLALESDFTQYAKLSDGNTFTGLQTIKSPTQDNDISKLFLYPSTVYLKSDSSSYDHTTAIYANSIEYTNIGGQSGITLEWPTDLTSIRHVNFQDKDITVAGLEDLMDYTKLNSRNDFEFSPSNGEEITLRYKSELGEIGPMKTFISPDRIQIVADTTDFNNARMILSPSQLTFVKGYGSMIFDTNETLTAERHAKFRDKDITVAGLEDLTDYAKLNQSNTFTTTQNIVGDLKTTSGASFGVSSTTAGVKIGRITNNLVYLSCQDAAGNPKALSITATATTYNGNVNFNDNMQLVGSLSMASLSGIGDRPIVADAGGVLKIGNPVVGLEDLETKANVKKTFNFSNDDFQCLFGADIEIVRASTKAITVNFGSASEVTGRVVTIKKTDYSGYPVYIQPFNGEYIEEGWGATLVNPYDYITLVSDGTNWLILGGKYTLIYPQG